MRILSFLNMRDAAAVLMEDGRLVAAAEEERFVRIKHVTALPVHAIRYCLSEAGVPLSAVDAVAVPWKYWQIGRRAWLAVTAMLTSPALCRVKARRTRERLGQEWMELATAPRRLAQAVHGPCPQPVYLDHHLCHAASTFLVSPFERAAILVVDGASESHTALLGLGEGHNIHVQHRVPLPHSLGQFYAAMTAFLGFQPDCDEYIVMGLAAHGEPRYADTIRRELLSFADDGTFCLNTRLLDFHLARVGLFSTALTRLFGPPRRRDDEIAARHRDLAASVQQVLEDILLAMARRLKRDTKLNALCLAGGVALNCVANGRLAREAGFDRVFVPPAPGDAGVPFGAALWLAGRRGLRRDQIGVLRAASWGPAFEEAACRAVLERAGLRFERMDELDLAERVAAELARGRLVFWFQGRMEWGPRALGNRSLLADPRREDMRELINAKVKRREPFRPFAPSILEERTGDYFETAVPSPFMQFTVPVRPAAKGVLPAVTHVDGSARIQTVDRESNVPYRRLLEAFERLTGVPVLLNTSFNVQEPIVCTPEDAVSCFLRTEVDWLVLGNLLVSRPDAARS